eukprot:scaffold5985_cov112-Isochrysis_galbana.AAC.1
MGQSPAQEGNLPPRGAISRPGGNLPPRKAISHPGGQSSGQRCNLPPRRRFPAQKRPGANPPPREVPGGRAAEPTSPALPRAARPRPPPASLAALRRYDPAASGAARGQCRGLCRFGKPRAQCGGARPSPRLRHRAGAPSSTPPPPRPPGVATIEYRPRTCPESRRPTSQRAATDADTDKVNGGRARHVIVARARPSSRRQPTRKQHCRLFIHARVHFTRRGSAAVHSVARVIRVAGMSCERGQGGGHRAAARRRVVFALV